MNGNEPFGWFSTGMVFWQEVACAPGDTLALALALGVLVGLTLVAGLFDDWLEQRLTDGSLPWDRPASREAWREGR